MPPEHRKCFAASASVWYGLEMQAEFIFICRSLFTSKLTDPSFNAQPQDLCTLVEKGVWSHARAIHSITCMQAPAYSLCCHTIPCYLSPHLLPTAQLCIPSFMKHDAGCGFVCWDKRVEGLHVYLPLTIHLALIQLSRESSNLIPNMTSTARLCVGRTSEHLFAEPCTVFSTPGRAREHEPVNPHVQGDWMCCTWDVESSAHTPMYG